jgi:hypothetical protein
LKLSLYRLLEKPIENTGRVSTPGKKGSLILILPPQCITKRYPSIAYSLFRPLCLSRSLFPAKALPKKKFLFLALL